MSCRSILTQALWNVAAHIPSTSAPIFSRRSLSSAAALFVKVTASMFHGFTLSSPKISERRSAASKLSISPARKLCAKATSSSDSSLTVLLLYALPKRSIFAIRLQSTVVLPLPAPATISTAPFMRNTAFFCISFVRLKYLFSICFFSVK